MLKHINLSDQVEQWQGLKDITGVESDRDPAKYLIDSYLESQTPPSLAGVIFESPVKRQQIEKQKVSTPIVGSKRLPSDPQISSVTEWSDSHEEKSVEAAHYDCNGVCDRRKQQLERFRRTHVNQRESPNYCIATTTNYRIKKKAKGKVILDD